LRFMASALSRQFVYTRKKRGKVSSPELILGLVVSLPFFFGEDYFFSRLDYKPKGYPYTLSSHFLRSMEQIQGIWLYELISTDFWAYGPCTVLSSLSVHEVLLDRLLGLKVQRPISFPLVWPGKIENIIAPVWMHESLKPNGLRYPSVSSTIP